MTQPVPAPRRAVIAVSSHVVRGSVGNRAIVFALQSLGHPVWAVPTVVLPWHPGHGPATRIVPPADGFAALMADLERAPWLPEVCAVISGYLGEAAQADAVAGLVRAVRAANPDAIYLCDPVIGDTAGLYVPQETAAAIRDVLVPLCDIATPNRPELAWLAGRDVADNDQAAEAARLLGPRRVLVTSAHAGPGRIGNLLVNGASALLAAHEQVDRPPNGTGDLLAALFLARLLAGASDADALAGAAEAVHDAVALAVAQGADELVLEADAGGFARPARRIVARPPREAPPPPAAVTVAGVDGCRAGWVVVRRDPDGTLSAFVAPTFEAVVSGLPDDAAIAVDMPIGLPDRVSAGGRGPEALARRRLGERQSSVFSIPSRAAVYAECGPFGSETEWRDAHARASTVARETSDPPRGVSIQAFALFAKVREIDTLLRERPALAARIAEAHPELAFWRLAGGRPMAKPKKVRGRINPAGMEERRSLLCGCGMPRPFLEGARPAGAGEDDFLDAAAVMFVAARLARGEAMSFPDPPGRDAHGLPVAIRA